MNLVPSLNTGGGTRSRSSDLKTRNSSTSPLPWLVAFLLGRTAPLNRFLLQVIFNLIQWKWRQSPTLRSPYYVSHNSTESLLTAHRAGNSADVTVMSPGRFNLRCSIFAAQMEHACAHSASSGNHSGFFFSLRFFSSPLSRRKLSKTVPEVWHFLFKTKARIDRFLSRLTIKHKKLFTTVKWPKVCGHWRCICLSLMNNSFQNKGSLFTYWSMLLLSLA